MPLDFVTLYIIFIQSDYPPGTEKIPRLFAGTPPYVAVSHTMQLNYCYYY